jgi:hypothetical protein
MAATRRRYFANSVITNQDHPANHLFLLAKGLVRFFFVTEEGKKLLFQWIGPGERYDRSIQKLCEDSTFREKMTKRFGASHAAFE